MRPRRQLSLAPAAVPPAEVATQASAAGGGPSGEVETGEEKVKRMGFQKETLLSHDFVRGVSVSLLGVLQRFRGVSVNHLLWVLVRMDCIPAINTSFQPAPSHVPNPISLPAPPQGPSPSRWGARNIISVLWGGAIRSHRTSRLHGPTHLRPIGSSADPTACTDRADRRPRTDGGCGRIPRGDGATETFGGRFNWMKSKGSCCPRDVEE